MKTKLQKRVLSELPQEVTKAALSRNTEQAAANATIIQNRGRLKLATPSRLALLLQYGIVRISLNRSAMKVSTFCERMSAPN